MWINGIKLGVVNLSHKKINSNLEWKTRSLSHRSSKAKEAGNPIFPPLKPSIDSRVWLTYTKSSSWILIKITPFNSVPSEPWLTNPETAVLEWWNPIIPMKIRNWTLMNGSNRQDKITNRSQGALRKKVWKETFLSSKNLFKAEGVNPTLIKTKFIQNRKNNKFLTKLTKSWKTATGMSSHKCKKARKIIPETSRSLLFIIILNKFKKFSQIER